MPEGPLDHVELKLMTTMQDVEDFRRWLGERREGLGFDTETSGLSPERDRVRLIQFGDMNVGWSIPWDDFRGVAVEVLKTYEGELDAHNSKFDIRQLCVDLGWDVNDWPWHRTNDTMGMAHILDSQRTRALKGLSGIHIDPRASFSQKDLHDGMARNGWDWGSVPTNFPPYWQYAALDPVLTAHLRHRFMPRIKAEFSELYDMEMGATRVAAKMEQQGMLIDDSYCLRKSTELMDYAQSARRYLQDQYNLENPTGHQLIKFFEANNVPLIDKTTASGAQSMDKEVLQAVDHEVARTTLAIRKAEKLAGSQYLGGFPSLQDTNGRVHPNIFTMGARTGRMSITEPALQTLPKKDPTVRKAFIPETGHVLISCDYDQIEARLTAHFSNDPGLIAAFKSDQDFFVYIATMLFGRPIAKSDPERQLVKGVVYGKIYGASVPKMAATAGVPTEQMRSVNNLFETTFGLVPQTMKRIIGVTKARAAQADDGRGYVITPYGRQLKADRGKEYAAVNYLIQCHASEILKSKMVQLDAALPTEARMLLPVHDEVIFEVPTELATDVQQLIEETMDSESYAVPITASSDIMLANWGEKRS